MKQCPACGNTYTDDTLSFCLSDGTLLSEIGTEQVTVVKGIPAIDRPAAFAAPASPTASGNPAGMSGILKILLACILLFFMVLAVLGIGGFIFYNSSGSQPVANKANAATAAPTPTTDTTSELRDQIANLEKRLNEQKASNRLPNMPANIPVPSSTTVGRANSPGDGFLALRSLPSSEAGERILKIPHGASVTIGACGPTITPVKRSGRWCQASYDGRSGWVFDAYIVY